MFRPQVLHSATDWSHDDFLRAMVPLLTESDEKSPEKLTADEAFLLSAWVVMLREEAPIRGFIDDLFLPENLDALHAVIADDQAGFVQAMLRLSPSVTLPSGQKATPTDAAQVVGLMEAVEKRILSISQPDGGPGHGSSPSEPPPSGSSASTSASASANNPSGPTAPATGGRTAAGGQGQSAAAHAQDAQGTSTSPARGAGGMTLSKTASAFRSSQAAASGASAPLGSAIPAWALVAGGVGILATGVVVSRVLKLASVMEPIDLGLGIRSYLASLLLSSLSDFDRNKIVAFSGIDPAAPKENWFFDDQVSYLSDAIVEWMGPQADPFFLDLYLLANRGFRFLSVDYRVGTVYLEGSTPEERARSVLVVDQRASDLDAKNREDGSDEWLERFFNKDVRQEIRLAPGETVLSSKYTEMARSRMGLEIESFARMVLLPRISYQDKTTAYLLWFTVRPTVDFREQIFAEIGKRWPATKALPAAFLVPPRRTTPLDRTYLPNGHLP